MKVGGRLFVHEQTGHLAPHKVYRLVPSVNHPGEDTTALPFLGLK